MEVSDLVQKRSNISLMFWKSITTFFGAGYFPYAPGTAGSLVALLPAMYILLFITHPNLWLLVLILVFGILGVIGSFKLEIIWGKDPQKVVVDEAVGMWISLLFIPPSWFLVLLAFALFRFFDIFKPLGINKTQKLAGGYGVMTDDILAGIVTNLILQAISKMV